MLFEIMDQFPQRNRYYCQDKPVLDNRIIITYYLNIIRRFINGKIRERKKRRNIMRYLFVLIVALFLSSTLDAQVRVSINLDTQPIWGPTGYDYVENYYFPDIEVYYNVPLHHFYYYERGRWISSSSLPPRFHNFDLYRSYKVVVNDREPWKNNATYKAKYYSFRGRHDQHPIRDSRDSKYFVNKNHPEHNKWAQQQKHVDRKPNIGKRVNAVRGNEKRRVNEKENIRDKHDNGRDKK